MSGCIFLYQKEMLEKKVIFIKDYKMKRDESCHSDQKAGPQN